jgi:hypothetical protein
MRAVATTREEPRLKSLFHGKTCFLCRAKTGLVRQQFSRKKERYEIWKQDFEKTFITVKKNLLILG